MEGTFVAYYRVSTQRQGNSGLGLEAQKASVEAYLNGGNWKLLKEFQETETGKGSNALERRPVLNEAIAFAKRHKAKLIIAKLDRLARNVAFVSALMESKVPFVCADMPEANELTLHIMAAMAQYESKRISERTREALQAAKRRGVKLGKVENLQKGCAERAENAEAFAMKLKPTLEALKAQGLSQRAMVEELNKLGAKTSAGKEWKLMTLQRVLKRLA
jgi:DNA invertase Pin-like site-specific DNA recombinase